MEWGSLSSHAGFAAGSLRGRVLCDILHASRAGLCTFPHAMVQLLPLDRGAGDGAGLAGDARLMPLQAEHQAVDAGADA